MSYRDVFGEILADHHESPRNWGKLSDATCTENGFNPLCGDKISLSIKLSGDPAHPTLEKCAYEGEGCSICMASASIMSEMVQGKSREEVIHLIELFREKMQGAEHVDGLPAEDASEDIVALYGIKRFPVRIKCALLAWTTLKKGMENQYAG
jgi:nitrogen fixation NifU-like protein